MDIDIILHGIFIKCTLLLIVVASDGVFSSFGKAEPLHG